MVLEPRRERRRPEAGALFQVVATHLATFLARVDDGERALPAFVRRELSAFLRCGILAHGFCRVHCARCAKSELVAFSCKRRGFCPSCGSRRMADLAAHLVDSVLPDVPVRQWVLSLPHRLRLLCAYDPEACAVVRRVFVRAVSGCYLRRARGDGAPRPNAGAVVFAQRFDSGLRLNLHFHGLWLDGAFACPPGSGRPWFDPHGEPTDRDVERMLRAIRARTLRALRRHGKLPTDDPAEHADEPSLLQELGAAAIAGRTALGERRGQHDLRPGRGSRTDPFRRGPLCAELDGFSLHAAVRIPAGCRERLEKLCRYAARPPIVEDRLSLLPDGRVCYRLKRRYRDGSTHVVLEPLTFLERLCALVPRPRRMLLTYHGLLAPAAGMRQRVVPPPLLPADDDGGCDHERRHGRQRRRVQPGRSPHAADVEAEANAEAARDDDADPRRRSGQPFVPHAPAKHRRPRARYSWAELLQRVFLVDVLTCPDCRGPRTLLTAIHDPASIQRILLHLGLPTEPPEVAPARPPPQANLPW